MPIHRSVAVVASRLGPHVSVEVRAIIEHRERSDAASGADSELRRCGLVASLVGEHCRADHVHGRLNIGDYCALSAKEQG